MPQARPSLPVNEVPPLSREKRNANTVKILQEFSDILEDMIEDLIENPPAPATKLTPKQRYEWFMRKIRETYAIPDPLTGAPVGVDEFGVQVELALLLDETLVDRIKAGLQQGTLQGMLLPIAPPFVNYIPNMLLGLRGWQRVFIRLHKQYGQEQVSA